MNVPAGRPGLQAGVSAPTLLVLAAFLVVYENVATLITGGELFISVPAALTIAAILVTAMIAWSGRCSLTLAELGLTRHGAARSAAIGLAVAAVVAAGAVVIVRIGPVVDGPVQYEPFATMSVGEVFARALLWVPLATVLPEELSFRGVLLALLRRRYADGRAALLSAIPFALWHGLIIVHTVGQTSLARTTWTMALGIIGGFVVVALGGLLFAYLRIRTGSLLAPLACHWAFNASVLIGLYLLQR
ncbi:MAG: CPBP family intramembrane metalloprotease [Chloroflexota bacterium]|nr:CPBP family intramembrane metalloprotease [Chloroflexota bacterium]